MSQHKIQNQLLLTIALSSYAIATTNNLGYSCVRYLPDNKQFYKLDDVNSNTNEYTAGLTSTHLGTGSGQLHFNICAPPPYNELCQQDVAALGYVITNDGGKDTCFYLSKKTGDPKTNTQWNFTNIPKIVQGLMEFVMPTNMLLRGAPSKERATMFRAALPVNNEGDSEGIQIYANNTAANVFTYNAELKLNCNVNATTAQDISATYENNLYTINLTHKDACGFAIFGFLDNLGAFKWVIGAVGAIAAFVMIFFGMKLYKPSLALIGLLAGGLATYIILGLFWENYNNDYKLWLMIGISLVLGGVLAFILVKTEKLTWFALGAFLGVILGFELYNLLVFRLEDGDGSHVRIFLR